MYITQIDFRSQDNGYNLYVFDIRFQKGYAASQSIKVRFEFIRLAGAVEVLLTAYALILTYGKLSISIDGQRQFDLI